MFDLFKTFALSKAFAPSEVFAEDEAGATAMEYGLIAALLAVAILGALSSGGTFLISLFEFINSTFQSVLS